MFRCQASLVSMVVSYISNLMMRNLLAHFSLHNWVGLPSKFDSPFLGHFLFKQQLLAKEVSRQNQVTDLCHGYQTTLHFHT